jgi:hypothetical protein
MEDRKKVGIGIRGNSKKSFVSSRTVATRRSSFGLVISWYLKLAPSRMEDVDGTDSVWTIRTPKGNKQGTE